MVLYDKFLDTTIQAPQFEDKFVNTDLQTAVEKHFTKPRGLAIMVVKYLRQEPRVLLQQQLHLQ